MIHPKLAEWNIAHQRVFLRADLNVPLSQGKISNDFRLKSILPTLNVLINKHASIILATHIGRPQNKEPELSTHILVDWFKNRGYQISFVEDFTTIPHLPIKPQEILLIENLRFFPGEKDSDSFFAKQLAHLADYYVNDAFGALHTHDCSITLLPYEFSENKRSIGFLIEKELSALNELIYNPPRPFIAILGGGKIKDKIPLIEKMIYKVDTMILYPALCFTFLKALGKPTGKSLIDNSLLETCRKIIHKAENHMIPFIFPVDYQVAYDSIQGPLEIVNAADFPKNAIGISVGPKSVEQCVSIIQQAKTIFFNCAMGFIDRPETQKSTKNIIYAMSRSCAKTVIAGGDSVNSALHTQNYSQITHLSTGGGAALAYLSDVLLPGLIPFEEE